MDDYHCSLRISKVYIKIVISLNDHFYECAFHIDKKLCLVECAVFS